LVVSGPRFHSFGQLSESNIFHKEITMQIFCFPAGRLHDQISEFALAAWKPVCFSLIEHSSLQHTNGKQYFTSEVLETL